MSTAGSPARAREAQRLLDLLNALGSTTFRQLVWQRASELDLTYAQSQVLFYVNDHASCHMGDVAKAFGVTLPAVTHIIDRLEQKQKHRSKLFWAATTAWVGVAVTSVWDRLTHR